MITEDWQSGGFGVYVHWPFCQSKCPYCDFNSHVAKQIDQDQWAKAYISEIDRLGRETPGRIVRSVFFGGGTPSLMAPGLVDEILERIGKTWRLANDVEITLEANPGSVEAARFAAYREAGVNRVSIGIQALNDADLTRLGRLHSASEARAALEIARSTFDRVSFDLIYARQDQNLADWQNELAEALGFAPDHLSLYQLTIEDGTAFGNLYAKGKLRGLPDEDLAADMYTATQELCNAAGLPAYEVSNHAKPGAESRHNLIYWSAGDYLGIGPGAHGRLTLNGVRYSTYCPPAPNDWLRWAAQPPVNDQREALSAETQATEYLMMGLRLKTGIDLERYQKIAGVGLPARKVAELTDLAMTETENGQLRATEAGRLVLNEVIRKLMG